MRRSLFFLIYDKINNEKLWYDYFKCIDKSKYNIYIHYKKDVNIGYFQKYKIKENDIIPTQWCGKSLVEVQNKLLEYHYNQTEREHEIVEHIFNNALENQHKFTNNIDC